MMEIIKSVDEDDYLQRINIQFRYHFEELIYFFLGAAFLAAGFLAAFLAGFLAAAFLAFLAAGFLAFLTFLTFLALGFLAFLAFLGFSTFPALNLPAPLPAALALTMVPAARAFLRASF